MSKVFDESFVTLATNENYAIGALTLAQSLRRVNTNRQLTILISSDLSLNLQNHLRQVFDVVQIVDVLNSNDTVNLALLKRPELGVTFTKLHCWRLTQFKKCVFLDADCLILRNVDELFDREEFSAVTDIGWPDCFNSGVFVFRPSDDTYTSLVEFAVQRGSFDGGDQGLLNSYFSNWSQSESSRRLPFIYNMTTNASYSYAPAFNQFKDSIKIVHFIGAQKPWYYTYNLDTSSVTGNTRSNEVEYLNSWWSIFAQTVLPSLNDETRTRLGSQLISQPKPSGSSQETQAQNWHQQSNEQPQSTPAHYPTGSVAGGVVVGSDHHQHLWEKGQIEYTGRDSFSNIQAHLDSQLKK